MTKRRGEPLRNVRIGDALWQAAKAKASWQGTTVSEIIRKYLRAYVEGEGATDEVRDVRD